MGYLNQFPRTYYYEQDIGFLMQAYKELLDKYDAFIDVYKIFIDTVDEDVQKLIDDGTIAGILNEQLMAKKVTFYDTIDSVKHADDVAKGMLIRVSGSHSIGDGGNALLYITDTVIDTFPYFEVNRNLYAMYLPQSNYNFEAFQPPEIINDVFNKVASWCSTFNIKLYLSNDYSVDLQSGLTVPSNLHLIGDSLHVLKGKTPYELTHYNILRIENVENVIIEKLKIDGVKEGNTSTTGEWGHCVGIYDSRYINIIDCELYNAFGDGIELGAREVRIIDPIVKVKNCYIHHCRRQGISILSGLDVEVSHCRIEHIRGVDPQSAIDIEPYFNSQKIGNIYIHDMNIYNCYAGIEVHGIGMNDNPNTITGNITIDNVNIDTGNVGLVTRYIQSHARINYIASNCNISNIYGSAILCTNNYRNCVSPVFRNINIVDCGYQYDTSGDEAKAVNIEVGSTHIAQTNQCGNYTLDNVNIYYSDGIAIPKYSIVFTARGVSDTNYNYYNIHIRTNTNRIKGCLHMVDSCVYTPPLFITEANYVVTDDEYASQFYIEFDGDIKLTFNSPQMSYKPNGLSYNFIFNKGPNVWVYSYWLLKPWGSQIGKQGLKTTSGDGSSISAKWGPNQWTVISLLGDWTKVDE